MTTKIGQRPDTKPLKVSSSRPTGRLERRP